MQRVFFEKLGYPAWPYYRGNPISGDIQMIVRTLFTSSHANCQSTKWPEMSLVMVNKLYLV